jgi:hypothetical protein
MSEPKVTDSPQTKREPPSPKASVDRIIGTSLLVVALLQGGVNALVVTAISQRGVEEPDRVEFAKLFLSTFALSATIAVALAVYVLPRVYGRSSAWQLSAITIALGAPLAGLPVSHPNGNDAYHATVDALRAFMVHYGPAFYTGEVVGIATGLILGVLAQHYRESEALARIDPAAFEQVKTAAREATSNEKEIKRLELQGAFLNNRAPRAWRLEAGILVASLLALTIAAQQGLSSWYTGDWQRQVSHTANNLTSIAWSGRAFVAVGRFGTIVTSVNGTSWALRPSGVSSDLWSVEWSGTQFIAVGDSGTVLTSYDGLDWTPRPSGIRGYLKAVTWSGRQFVVVGAGGAIATSPDASRWMAPTSPATNDLEGIVGSGSRFVAVGENGNVVTSVDGRQWTTGYAGTNQYLAGVAWSGIRFVIVGSAGTIRTSLDGIVWAAPSAGTPIDLGGVTWTGSRFVAVGKGILTSPTGTTWSPESTGTSAYLGGIAWSGRQLVAVGNSGTILTSF